MEVDCEVVLIWALCVGYSLSSLWSFIFWFGCVGLFLIEARLVTHAFNPRQRQVISMSEFEAILVYQVSSPGQAPKLP